jgi:predicted DNA-binding transcriptional regulator YafY
MTDIKVGDVYYTIEEGYHLTVVKPGECNGWVRARNKLTERCDWWQLSKLRSADPTDGTQEALQLYPLELAVKHGLTAYFAYDAADGSRSYRAVRPKEIANMCGNTVVICDDLGAHDVRSFRLDRIAGTVFIERASEPYL